MRRKKPEPTFLPTQVIVNLPHHLGMVQEEVALDDAVSYILGTKGGFLFNVVMCMKFMSDVDLFLKKEEKKGNSFH